MKKIHISLFLLLFIGIFSSEITFSATNEALTLPKTSSEKEILHSTEWNKMVNNLNNLDKRTAEVVSISTGNVGIGTNSPSEKLEVAGNIKATGTICDGNGNCLNIPKGILTESDPKLFEKNLDKIAVTTSGNVGIGTINPSSKLEVNGAISVQNINQFPIGAGIFQGLNILQVVGGTSGFAINNSSNSISNFIVKDSGNVGIGTTAPVDKLDVAGGNIATNQYLKINAWPGYGTGSATFWFNGVGSSSGQQKTLSLSGSHLIVQANDLYVDGNVGIGTRTPSVKLEVNGTINATAFFYSSDRRWKKEITPLSSALQKISLLQGVSFEWDTKKFPEKKFPEGKQIGFIAQDVEKILPEMVKTDGQGYKSVGYGNMTALLVEGMKELQKENELQKVEIAELKAQNEEILMQIRLLK